MTEDSEKRFQAIMKKLFHTPNNSTNSGRTPVSRGKITLSVSTLKAELSLRASLEQSPGNSNLGSKSCSIPTGTQTPLCRPWDRGDLIRRLATFKSLTWFGKPKVVSPVNCARRGWINAEMDIIACEACGTRLLFSTPPSWTQQQVEKAAAVFSLKLDNGHKSLCPWNDNICDEKLAEFPLTPAPALVEGYRDRCYALMGLSALPRISSLAIDCMRNPQLDHFLAQSSILPCISLDGRNPCRGEEPGNEIDATPASLYFQALKLISLYGWEPRQLPYVVQCEERLTESAKPTYPSESYLGIFHGQNPGILLHSTTSADEAAELKESSPALGEPQPDPASVVLDCKLCGARIGLWAFSTVERPLLLFNLIDTPQVINNQSQPICCGPENLDKDMLDRNSEVISPNCDSAIAPKDSSMSLNLTIAGGPPPTKQNFRPTVSFPIVSRHLRAGFCFHPNDKNLETPSGLCKKQDNNQCSGQNNNFEWNKKDNDVDTHIGQEVGSEDGGTLKRKRSSDLDIETRHFDYQGLPSVYATDMCSDERGDISIKGMQNVPRDSSTDDLCLQSTQHAVCTVSSGEEQGPLIKLDDPCNQHGENFSVADTSLCRVTSQNSHHDYPDVPFCLNIKGTVESTKSVEFENAEKGSDFQDSATMQEENQGEGMRKVLYSVGNATVAAHESDKDVNLVPWDKTLEFDPIRQHRHFCPWISSTGGTDACLPGYQLTLSALDLADEASHTSPMTFQPTLSTEVDDPIASVRRLFKSPTLKRMKDISRSS